MSIATGSSEKLQSSAPRASAMISKPGVLKAVKWLRSVVRAKLETWKEFGKPTLHTRLLNPNAYRLLPMFCPLQEEDDFAHFEEMNAAIMNLEDSAGSQDSGDAELRSKFQQVLQISMADQMKDRSCRGYILEVLTGYKVFEDLR